MDLATPRAWYLYEIYRSNKDAERQRSLHAVDMTERQYSRLNISSQTSAYRLETRNHEIPLRAKDASSSIPR